MRIPYYHVDAFAGAPFRGNPAGVCLLEEWLDAETLQRIAAENNLSETAFIVRRAGHHDLRWFTPTVEVDLCGHGTLASAHVLFTHAGLKDASVEFHSQSGPLTVRRQGELLVLDFPSRPALPCEAPEVLVTGLGGRPLETYMARDYLCVYSEASEVAALAPDMKLLATLPFGVIATAPGGGEEYPPRGGAPGAPRGGGGVDFVSRFFVPAGGIPEDPVTGSSHCTLVPYWAKRLGKTALAARQISARGGELTCRDEGDRVMNGGRAVTFMEGHITI